MTLSPKAYAALADLMLAAHFAFVLFVVGGFVMTWIGYFCGWEFVRNFWFRLAHLLAMAVVFLEALGGVVCPLTTWEEQLRALAGQQRDYGGSFIQHWLHRLMFFDLSERTFQVVYGLSFAFLVLTFCVVRPRGPKRAKRVGEG